LINNLRVKVGRRQVLRKKNLAQRGWVTNGRAIMDIMGQIRERAE